MDIKYGKKIENQMAFKQQFITDNDRLLEERNRIAKIYNKQPLRTNCKVCRNSLELGMQYSSHGIKYFKCPICGHLNGEHEETAEFTNMVYCTENYGMTYSEQEEKKYNSRTTSIYVPKARFMRDALEKENVLRFADWKVLDIGAGSGYFVNALDKIGIEASGIDISKLQVDYGNQMLHKKVLECVPEQEIVSFIENTTCNIVSAIGVLEHIINLHDVLQAIAGNDHIKYLYFSVPLFSLSCIFEAANNEVFNRQLGGAHTHLFSLNSIQYMNHLYGFQEISRWQFGVDMMDLYRSLLYLLQENSSFIQQELTAQFLPLIDKLQLVVDEAGVASEVHVLVKKHGDN